MATPPENMPFTTNVIEGVKEGYNPPPRNARNQQNLEAAKKLGFNEEVVIWSNPELTQEAEQLNKRRENTSRIVKWVTAVSAGLGAAATLLMFKKSQGAGKWAKRGVTAIFTGGGAGLAGGMLSSAALDKGDVKKYTEFQDIESAAIERLTANARNLTIVPLPEGQTPPTKEFTSAVTPRDTCHATQAVKDAAVPGTHAIST